MKINNRSVKTYPLKRSVLRTGEVYECSPSDSVSVSYHMCVNPLGDIRNTQKQLVNLRTGICWEPTEDKNFRLLSDAELAL